MFLWFKIMYIIRAKAKINANIPSGMFHLFAVDNEVLSSTKNKTAVNISRAVARINATQTIALGKQ